MPTSLDYSESEKILISEINKTEDKLIIMIDKIKNKELMEVFSLFLTQTAQANRITTTKIELVYKAFKSLL